jgi:hypothetical protein
VKVDPGIVAAAEARILRTAGHRMLARIARAAQQRPSAMIKSIDMASGASAAAQRVVAVLSLTACAVAGCDGYDGAEGVGATAGTAASIGGSSTGGQAGSSGGKAGAGVSGSVGTECTTAADCTGFSDCYTVSCDAGTCRGVTLPRGSACADGFCNGFARCLPCLDDAPGLQEDTGCSADAPVCPETSAEPACVGCEEDADCNDGLECTADRCTDSACENVPLPLGRPCREGVCNGETGSDSCTACVDDASTGTDVGCTKDRPRCDTTSTPPLCAGCQEAGDCDDENTCTTESCTANGVCEHATLVSGTPCPDGYCNGIPGVELCVPKPCQSDADCNDGADCTTDVCDSTFCAYTTDDTRCEDSGDVCQPNVCTVGTGCQRVDHTDPRQLLVNGTLDLGNVDWMEMSATYPQVIYHFDYVPTLLPHTEPYVAWLGGGEGLMDESNSLTQVVSVPAATARLDLTFFYQIWTEDGLPDDHNYMRVRLLSSEASEDLEEIVTFHNQDATRVWTRFTASLDAGRWAGSDVALEFSGIGIDGFTHFFVDSITLLATVCE